MRSSQAAVNLIVANEVTSREVYETKYERPEWPGGASGLTVGIGYDLGYNSAAQIQEDWSEHLAPATIRAMQRYAGLTAAAAKAQLSASRQSIIVPWDAAMAVFMAVSLPKFEAATLRACPGSEKLPAGCFGVLASLTYNRGASYTKPGDRYIEMRNIRTHVVTGEWDRVPADIRSMKRLWPDVTGLRRRRDEEAALWEASLRAAPQIEAEPLVGRVDTGDDKDIDDVTLEGNDAPLNVQNKHPSYSLEVELIQRELIDMRYFEVGDPDGLAGGKLVAGISAFMNDRGKDPAGGKITPEFKAELSAAKQERLPNGEKWSRPIAEARAKATAKDIAPKVASVNATWYQKLLAYILGIPSLVGAGLKGLFGDDTTGGYIQQVKGIFAAIPTELYLLGAAGLAVAIFLAAKSAQDATVKAYNEGKIN